MNRVRPIDRLALTGLWCCWLVALTATGTVRLAGVAKPAAQWEVLKDCNLLVDEYRDGDSFHVRYHGKEFVFRLYFVDAPETDENQKDRIREQRRHFGVTLPELRRAGEEARRFTAEQLRRAFVVTTRWQNAGGRGRLPRFYAFVTVNGSDLGELLVSKGLARAFGEDAILPTGVRAKDHMAKLRRIEREARASRLGVWKNSTDRRK